MSDPINPSKDPSYPLVPSPRSNPIEPKNSGKFKEILEKEEDPYVGTRDFLGIKTNAKGKMFIWKAMLQIWEQESRIQTNNMLEELKRQQREIEHPDE